MPTYKPFSPPTAASLLGLAMFFGTCNPALAQESRKHSSPVNRRKSQPNFGDTNREGAERFIRKVEHVFISQPSGLYPWFEQRLRGGGFTLGAGYRRYYGDSTHWDLKGLYSIKNYKLIELSTDSWEPRRRPPRPARARRLARRDRRSPTTASASTVPHDGTNFRMKQAYVGGDAAGAAGRLHGVRRRRRPTRTTRSEPAPGGEPSIEEVFTPATAPGLGAEPALPPHRRRRAASTGGRRRLRAPRRALRGPLPQLRRPRRRPTASTASTPRSCSTSRSCARTGCISLRGRVQTTLDDDDVGAVLPAAVARQRQHAARLQQLALPRSPQPADVRRVALDPQPARARHGGVLRRRHGRSRLRAISA